jgi:serine phosphatase RsbU (regulator of sigma subunit)
VFGALDAQPEAKLRGVIEIGRALAGSLDVPSLLPKMLDTLFAIFPHADRGCILLRDADSGRMIPAVQKHRRAGEDSTVRLSRTVLAKVLEEKAAILSADAASDARFQASESISSLTIRSMMCAPLLSLDGEPLGIIDIDTQNAFKQFTKDDLDLLAAVAAQAALSLETARLMQSYVDKQRQDGEMRIARNVQHALLPESLPQVPGYEFFAAYESAQEVGGDYYDCFPLPDGRIAVSFGDVAGKGVPGALVMARMSTVVQNTLAFVHEVGPAVATINSHMCSHAVDGRFVTYVLAFVDPRTHRIALANAGHVAPLVRRADGTLEEFAEETIGLPVGVLEDYPYEVVERELASGEQVVIVTDGVTEAMNPAGELYGTDRLKQLLSASQGGPSATGRAILADVRRHAAGRDQNDDITVMTFGRLA